MEAVDDINSGYKNNKKTAQVDRIDREQNN